MPTMLPLRRGFALWILTKFAMLFFIFALAGVMLSLSNAQKNTACESQAQNSINAISAKVSQLIYSPSEDERQSFAFTSVLALGEGGERYELNTTYRSMPDKPSYLSLQVNSLTSACSASSSVIVGESASHPVIFFSSIPLVVAGNNANYLFTPSNSDLSARSRYLIVVKCSEKKPNGRIFLFVQDCKRSDLSECQELNFGTANNIIDNCCGWIPSGSCPF